MITSLSDSEISDKQRNKTEINFTWLPQKVMGDDPNVFKPKYIVVEEAETLILSLKSKFADLPSAGIWENRNESDEELLEQLGKGWRGFASEQ